MLLLSIGLEPAPSLDAGGNQPPEPMPWCGPVPPTHMSTLLPM